VVLALRISETLSLTGEAVVRVGLSHDSVCYLGSYEIVVCSILFPPYETFMAILALLLTTLVLASSKKEK
jgi:hypothetical protein